MNRCLLVFFLAVIFPLPISAQTTSARIDWYRIYDGPGNGVDMTNDIKIDGASNIYLAGRSAGQDSSQDLLLLKYSGKGDSRLELRYSSALHSWDEAASIAVDADSNIYVIGSATFEQNTFYAIFHKNSKTGTLLWARHFNADVNIYSEGRQVLLNSKAEAIIGYEQKGAKIAKYSPSGDSLWTASIRDDTSSYDINYLLADHDDNIYAALRQAWSNGSDVPATRVVLVKLNDSGNILWHRELSGTGSRKMIFDREGEILLLVGDNEIIKLTPDGDSLWAKAYPNTGDIVITTDLGVDSHNDLIFTGYGLGEDSWDYFTYKLSAAGQEIWTKTFNSDEGLNDFAMSLALDKEDNIYVTGGTHNSISIGMCYTLKYSSAGELQWRVKFDAPHSKFEQGNRVFVDDSNNVFVGGDVADSTNGWNFLALKINQEGSLGIKPLTNRTPIDFSLSQNYPNPFNPSTTIGYALPHRSHVTLAVYNTLGQHVATLVGGEDKAGYHEVQFTAKNLASGVYFYRLQTGDFVQTRKFLLVR